MGEPTPCRDAGWAAIQHEPAAICIPCYLLLRDRMFWAEAEVIRLGGKVRPVEDYLQLNDGRDDA
jgi:hypothetical protein